MKLKKEVKVGIFALLVLLALYWGVNFLRGQDLFGRNNTYYAMYESVNGVQKSSAINIKGVRVGVVSDIIYEPSRSDKVILEFSIDTDYRIPDNSKARISSSILGSTSVEIEMGDSDYYMQNGDTLRSELDKDLLEVAGSSLDVLMQRVNTLANDVSATLATLNVLMADNTENITNTLSNLSGISGSLNQVLAAESETIRGIIDNMNALSATLKDNSGRIDNIMANVESFTDSLAMASVPQMVDSLSVTLGQLNATLTAVNQGEGSLGKLIADEQLYNSLLEASDNLAALLQDVKDRPGRYVNISVFGRRNRD